MSKPTNWPTTDRYFYKSLLNTNDVLYLLTKKLNFTPKQIGKSIFFLCPFHDDKNPSLSFEPQKKIFTCFSCSFRANDIFDFWAQYKKISFELALEEISQSGFSEKIAPLLVQKKKVQEQEVKDKPFDLLLLISDIYQHNLFTLSGKEVRNYLVQRQVDYPLINRFGLGASINSWQMTNLFYNKSEKVTKNLLLANLIWVGENNQVGDYFAARQLIIPLTDTEGRTVAFAARQTGDLSSKETSKIFPKYKYLPTYQYYHKSALLYNYPTAKKSRTEECYVVEGFFDVISLVKAGIENCVALLGTNLTSEQMKLLTNLKKRIVLFLDSDAAGQLATVNIALQLLKQEIDCEMVKPKYQGDPDEVCRQFNQPQEEFNHSDTEKGTLSIQEVLQKRENPYLFVLNYYFNKWEVKENPQRIKHFVSEIALLFQKFKINIRQFLVEEVSQLVNWEREQVELYFVPRHFPIPHFSRIKYYGQTIIYGLEKKIISLCFQEQFFWLLVITKKYFFNHPVNRKNWQTLRHYYISLGKQNFVNQVFLEKERAKLAELLKPEENVYQKKEGDKESSSTLNFLFQKIEEIRLFMAKI